MLVTQVPPSTSPNSQPAIAFDQCLQNRLDELGLEEAELVNRYTAHLQANRNSRRNVALRSLRGEADPTLATVFDLVYPEVLDGELMIQWGKDDGFVLPDLEAISTALRNRMIELGLDPAVPSDVGEVARRYLEVRYGAQERDRWPYVGTIRKMIGDSPNPQMQTFIQVVQALGGQVLVRWLVTVRKPLPADMVPPDLKGISGARPVILEYQEWSVPVVLSGN